jgi:hypothetical protein
MFHKLIANFKKSKTHVPPAPEIKTQSMNKTAPTVDVENKSETPATENNQPQKNEANDSSYEEAAQQLNKLRQVQAEKLSVLQAQMLAHLSPIELAELALDLKVKIEDLPRTSDRTAILNFVTYMERRACIPDLLAALTERWPEVDWRTAETLQAIDDLNQFRSRPLLPQSRMTSPPNINWPRLLNTYFNQNELADLAFEMYIDFDALPGNGKQAKVNALLDQIGEGERWGELAEFFVKKRPHINLTEGGTAVSSPSLPVQQQYRQKLELLNLEELQALCQQLGIDFEDLDGVNKSSKARELAVLLARHNRLTDLDPLLANIQAKDNETAVYHTQHIRALIFQVFPDDAALTDFCRKHLPEAVYEFGSGMSYRQKVQALLEFCTLKKQFTPLLAALEANFPEAHSVGGPYTQESPQPRPMPKPVQGKALLNDEWIDRAKREGRE